MSLRARCAGLAAIVALVVGVGATPAGAHSLTGNQGTDYKTEIFGITPATPGIEVRAIDLGNRVELRNDSDHVVVVEGYAREPYLKVGPTGAFRNERSPATYLNQTTKLPGPAPRTYRAGATPEWSRIGGDVVRWHDHRTHWMGLSAPPVVQHDPSHRHVLIAHWTVPLTIDGRPAKITGDVVWIPGPSPWRWVGVALVVAAAVIGLGVLVRSRAFATLFAAGAAISLAMAVGSWRYGTGSLPARFVNDLYDVVALGLLAAAVVLFVRRPDRSRWSPLTIFAGLALAVGTGLANVAMLFRSQLPTVLAPDVARALVAAAMGTGVGLVVIGARNLRPVGPQPRRRRTPPAPVLRTDR